MEDKLWGRVRSDVQQQDNKVGSSILKMWCHIVTGVR